MDGCNNELYMELVGGCSEALKCKRNEPQWSFPLEASYSGDL